MAEPRTKVGWVKTSARLAAGKTNKNRNLSAEKMGTKKPATAGKRTARPR